MSAVQLAINQPQSSRPASRLASRPSAQSSLSSSPFHLKDWIERQLLGGECGKHDQLELEALEASSQDAQDKRERRPLHDSLS